MRYIATRHFPNATSGEDIELTSWRSKPLASREAVLEALADRLRHEARAAFRYLSGAPSERSIELSLARAELAGKLSVGRGLDTETTTTDTHTGRVEDPSGVVWGFYAIP
jgi:acyl-CoA reductase-like NAD-dependent aldehyde dehydrogenase